VRYGEPVPGVPPTLLSTFLALTAFVSGCTPDPGDSAAVEAEAYHLEDAHNLSFGLALEADSTELLAGNDATLSWSELEEDLLGRPLSSCEAITQASLHLLGAEEEDQVLSVLAMGGFPQDRVRATWSCAPADCSCLLSSFSFVGHALVPAVDFVEGRGLWLMTLSGQPGEGLAGLAFLDPSASGGVELLIDDESFTARVQDVVVPSSPLQLSELDAATLDWSRLTLDSLGQPLDLARLDRLTLLRSELSPEQATQDPLVLAGLGVEQWEVDIQGASHRVELAFLEGEQPLEGLDHAHTWLLSLWSSASLFELPAVTVELRPGEPQG
jgi:hypothetical protein